MKNTLPFSLVKRNSVYYVRLKDDNGKIVAWKSTKQKDYNSALKVGFEIFATSKQTVEQAANRSKIRQNDLSDDEIALLLQQLQKQGKLKTFVLSESPQDIKAFDYAVDFWNKDKSEYIKARTRRGLTNFEQHLRACNGYLNNYWKDFLGDKLLGEITRNDIKKMFSVMDSLDRNGNTKNHIMRAMLTPLKHAYHNELINLDLFSGWSFYKTDYTKKDIISWNVARQLFEKQWKSPVAKLANMLAACTGMRIGEITALSLDEIGNDFIHIRYSYNHYDKLKCTKNGEERIEQVVFTPIIDLLQKLGSTNPYTKGRKYIFYAAAPDKPLEPKYFTKHLRYELEELGISKEDCKRYSFHSWRHFYTSYMKGKIDDKLLQSQTGHKTLKMLEHYSNHETEGDLKKIKDAQTEVFVNLFNFSI